MFAWSVGGSYCFTGDLSDCDGGPPFVFRGSNSDVQVNVGELQMVSMSSRRLGTFLLRLVSLILGIDLLLWKKENKVSVNSIWKTPSTVSLTNNTSVSFSSLCSWRIVCTVVTFLDDNQFYAFFPHFCISVSRVQVLPAFSHSAGVEEEKKKWHGR